MAALAPAAPSIATQATRWTRRWRMMPAETGQNNKMNNECPLRKPGGGFRKADRVGRVKIKISDLWDC